MCLGVPGRVIDIYVSDGMRMGKVDFGGLVKDVCLAYVPEIKVGDYTIVHVGFAITQIDEASAQESLALFRQLDSFDEAAGVEAAGDEAATEEQFTKMKDRSARALS